MDVVLSRHASDRLYDRRLEAIAAPLGRGLAITVVGFAVVGAAVMALLRVPLAFAVPGTVLTVVVGAQWLMLSVGSGLCSPNVVLGAFSVGAPVSVVAALVLGRGLGPGRGRLSLRVRNRPALHVGSTPGRRDARAAGQRGRARAALAGPRGVQAPRRGFVRLPPVDLGRQADPLAARRSATGGAVHRQRGVVLVLRHPGVRLDLRADRDGLLSTLPRVLQLARGGRDAPPAETARPDRSRRGAAHLAGRSAGPRRGHPGGTDGGSPRAARGRPAAERRHRCTASR